FSNSIFPATTWNLGPDVVTEEHNDLLNFGVCGIASGGSYNHKRGGHLYMKQLKLVIEFPSGSSVLIPSAAITHGNTPIAKGETRYSMTQYAAGALFDGQVWVQEREGPSGAGRWGGEEETVDGDPEARAAWALGLFSKIDELEEDRRAIFGRDYYRN
ncbi:hypothetical protein B0H13DRAFT_1649273, partial [Mycena leptocephala]